VSGASAAASGRPVGWDLPDRDVAVIDTATLGVTYVPRLMNVCMDLAVDATSGNVYVVGTDATNERRFEPKLSGRFLRVLLARVSRRPAAPQIVDLNPHLTYATARVAPALRAQSIGDPRAVVVDGAGGRVYVAGMGSDNLVVLDLAGARAPTPVARPWPAGLALDVPRGGCTRGTGSSTVSVVHRHARRVVRVPFLGRRRWWLRRARAL
jgi:DNA-binding beta-propeller fold protein YncE